MKNRILLTLVGFSFLFLPLQAQINLVLDVFSWQGNNGAYPYGSPVISGSTLYGMTYQGGFCTEHGQGTIFKVQLDGTGFTRIHEFCGQDGSYPYGSLIVAGSTIFGMTTSGGSSDSGTIFKIETDGTGFTVLHSFNGNGFRPYGSLILSGSTLYGMTQKGGINNKGTIFKIETNGTGFTLLHEFAGGSDDGAYPYGSLIISGPTLFGMTENGGAGDQGTIFKIQADGSGFSLKHSFAGGSADGALPKGDLLISGSTIFGMTRKGGSSDNGTIFKIQTNGTGFALLHQFAGGPTDGGEPWGALAISGSTLFGMTRNGGNMNMGTIFRVETDGNGFLLMHKFAGHPWGGARPHGSLLLLGSTLYGLTSGGGFHASGIVFSIDPSARDIIHVNAPVGGETWKAGSSHDITWTTTGTVASVNIDYSPDNNSNWIPVAADIANNEIPPQTYIKPSTTVNRKNFQFSSSNPLSTVIKTAGVNNYTWIVPDTPSPNCLIRIRDAARASTSGISNAVFSILMNLDLQAERLEVKSFSIVKQYGQIQFMGGQQNAAVAEYRIMRREGTADFVLLKTITPAELQNTQFQMQDKYLKKDTAYTYRVEAYNGSGQLVGISAEKTI